MDDVGQENFDMPEMKPSSFSPKVRSNSATVALACWPLTRKIAMSVSASASFLHQKIIHTLIFKIKTNIPAKLVECLL